MSDWKPSKHALARQIGPDLFLLEGRELSGAELEAAVEAQAEDDYALNDLKRELELDVTLQGQDLHDAALRLLASRGVHAPSYRELEEAYMELGA